MVEEFLSIEQVAEQLGISAATVRRRIKKGEMKAIKRPGPYGDQYYIPSNEVSSTAQEITDVVPVVRQFNAQELAGFISLAIQRENEDLHLEIKELYPSSWTSLIWGILWKRLDHTLHTPGDCIGSFLILCTSYY